VLRELLRYRRKLVEEESAERNRLQKLLETAGIKLGSVATDVLGVSGQAMLRVLIESSASPEEMANVARGRLRNKRAELIKALTGRIESHHRFLLTMQLRRVEAFEEDIRTVDERIAMRLAPYDTQMALLMQIPGVDLVVAAVIIAEVGTDMSVFVSVHHLAAWAGCVRAATRAPAADLASGPARATRTCA
jgi:transposase